ncbi:MAG: hypothetical protein RBS57_06270 [Desulforhabdus sp.]|jgi:hypothetical protein|nr:hypothetical protein [Desulforhabdus sp.]
MLPSTTSRVPENTAEYINERILHEIEMNVAYFAGAGRKAIDSRLAELDREWDIERILEANAASFSLLGLALGVALNRKWLLLPTAVASFLLQHALQGWCPPVPFFRRKGIRTSAEIDYERYALKALRGDFNDLPQRSDGSKASKILDAVMK